MTFKQLLKNYTWLTISSKFSEIYPEAEKNMDGYKAVFEKLVMMDPDKTNISIIIAKQKDDDDEYIDVSGLHNNPKNEGEKYAQGLELTRWCKWLGMEIDKTTLSEFSELEIIVHCLHEMTYVGFSEDDIQKKINAIEKRRLNHETHKAENHYVCEVVINKFLKQ